HRDRFKCHPNDANRSGISQPVTIVDRVIGDPFLYNSLFQSQASLNGTSCHIRYLDMKDETNHPADDPQNIANSVCSASQRANKSVRISKPTYYVDLVATRAKK
ncbi:hypothetical protein BY996DRAFT_4585482, partial [Phakopsora pachyrhizi]